MRNVVVWRKYKNDGMGGERGRRLEWPPMLGRGEERVTLRKSRSGWSEVYFDKLITFPSFGPGSSHSESFGSVNAF